MTFPYVTVARLIAAGAIIAAAVFIATLV